jgi:hypothetical protein
MTVLRTLRKLVLGETWWLPVGVALVLIAGLVLHEAAPDAWSGAGGFLVLAGVLAVLLTGIARGAR